MIACPVCGLALFRTGGITWWCSACERAYGAAELAAALAACKCRDCGRPLPLAPALEPEELDAPLCILCQAEAALVEGRAGPLDSPGGKM